MLRSMYSAVSGMQGFQTQLDVIGNNIANVETVGFKAGRVDFADVLSQTMSGGSAPGTVTVGGVSQPMGGTNPQQIGLGVKVAAIDTLFTQGATQTTGVNTDLAINGDGLFVVTRDGGQTYNYTRAGDFSVDANGNLVLPNGAVAMGYKSAAPSAKIDATPGADKNLQPVNLKNFLPTVSASPDLQIGPDGSLTVTDNTGTRQLIGYLVLATPPNPAGMERVGDNLFAVSPDSGVPTVPGAANTTTTYFQTPEQNNSGYLQSGALEMSNVDLTTEFTNMIVAQRAFDATSHVIGTDNAILNDIVNLKNS
ncbi:MAG: flagellar hook-basal body complex protein [Alicyclobacillus sp.]|nr:flagellar hook-basal body complex protein [Alicyclobacillus sp.]